MQHLREAEERRERRLQMVQLVIMFNKVFIQPLKQMDGMVTAMNRWMED